MKKYIVILKNGYVVEIKAETYQTHDDCIVFYKYIERPCETIKETVAVFVIENIAGFCLD